MNKRFSTLLAAALVAGGMSAMAAPSEANVAKTVAKATGTSLDKGTYYHLLTSTSVDAGALSFAKTYDGKSDSLFIRTAAKNGTIDAAGIDSALWAIDSTYVTALGYAYTFANKVTGKKIALDIENGIPVLTDEATAFAWGGTIGGALSYVASDGKTYALKNNAAAIQEGDASALSVTPYTAAPIALDADALNAANNDYFQLAFEDDVVGNVFTNANYKLQAVDLGSDKVAIRVLGATGLKVKDNPKAVNDTLFIVADTVKYGAASAGFDDLSGFKFVLDTAGRVAATNSAFATDGKVTAPAGNRVIESYQFQFYLNPGSAKGDSLTIVVGGPQNSSAPDATSGSMFKKGASYISYATVTGLTGKLITTASTETKMLPYITFKTGTKANVADGAYFITYVKSSTKANNGKDAVYNILGAAAPEKGAASEFVASSQWSIKKNALGKYSIKNREFGGAFDSENYIYAFGDNYIFGQDTIKLTPVTTTSKTVGYFNYTDEELANKAVSLQFISPIGTSAYVGIKKDSTLFASEMDESDAPKFKLVKAATTKFGPDELVRDAYFLIEQFGNKRALGLESATSNEQNGTTAGVQFKMIMGEDGATTHYADTIAVILRATAKEGEYQMIATTATRKSNDTDTYTAEYVTSGTPNVQGTITGSNALMQTVALGATTLGTFKVVTPAAPEYLNIIDNKPSHQRLYSSANTTLAIGMGAEGEGMLKAVSELKSNFEANDFKMYVDTACVEDVTKPLFYILTTAGIEDAQKEDGIANYLSTADNSKLAYVPASQYGLGNDTILYYNAKDFTKAPDSVNVNKSKSAFAFRATDTDGEFLIEAAASGKCLAQENGILYLVNPNEKEALAFCTETVEAPTSNEGVEVSEVTVIAGEGQVTIAGAAGKKVVISNILGQPVAKTVVSSDNAVIAAPQGIIVVAVEGEEAVKTIVK
ncbi:DUF6383 domain-containing protein [uncultured Parabacteroides sp.]|uniref:DUF6383 domain-containing protein n=1 Tax=uncultured Parabacteroides sp. TaxID=512312 RepID=UPI00265A9A36|nr:DUF6383 domain-containing protein [uncultured Parabacteroides sp.]